MTRRGFSFTLIVLITYTTFSQENPKIEKNLAGVYQGNTLFIQNSLDKSGKDFCIKSIYINERELDINYRLSAIKIDFDGYDLLSPVKIRIVHKDTLCTSTIINPEAILFHTIFRFVSVSLSDTVLAWTTKGETGVGGFEIQKLINAIWVDQEIKIATGLYNGANYAHFPTLDEGANKYRIRYNFPKGNRIDYLYSREVDYDHYPEPIKFKPKYVKTRMYLSRSTHYEIYDTRRNLVLEGQGIEIDMTKLRSGQYVIYFDGNDPRVFIKE